MSSHSRNYEKEEEDDDRQRASSVCDDTNDSTRFENLSHKLQRSFQEKNMMLDEIQSLKKQVHRSFINTLEQSSELRLLVAIDAEREAWNRLIDANVRSGIMACIWCMKAQVVKITAMAFHKWKTYSLLDMSKKVLLNNINNQHNYNGIRDSGVNSNSNFKHDNNFINNFTNIPFDPNGRDATMEAAAAAAQYFQQLMLQIPLNEYSNIKINIPTEPYTTEGRGVNALTSKAPTIGSESQNRLQQGNGVMQELGQNRNIYPPPTERQDEPRMYAQVETRTQVQEEPHHRQPLRGRSNTAIPRKFKNDNLDRVPFGRFHSSSPSRSRSASPSRPRHVGQGSPQKFQNRVPGSPVDTHYQDSGSHIQNNNWVNGPRNDGANANNKLNLQLQGINHRCNNRPEPAPYYMSPTASYSSKKKSSTSSTSGSRPGIKVGSISSRPTYNLSTYEKSSKLNNQNLNRNIYSLRNTSFDLSESGYANSSMSQSLMKSGKYNVDNLTKNIYDDAAGYDYDNDKLRSRNIDKYASNDDGYISNSGKSGGFSDKILKNSAQNGMLQKNQKKNEDQEHFVSRNNPRSLVENSKIYRNGNVEASSIRNTKEKISNVNPSHPVKNFDSRSSGKILGPKLETKNADPRSRPYGTGEKIRNGGAGTGQITGHTDDSAFNENNYFHSSDNHGNRNNYMKYNDVNGDVEREEVGAGYDYGTEYMSAGRVRDVYTMPQFKRYQDQMGVHSYLQR